MKNNEINMIKVYEKEQEAKNNIERKLNNNLKGVYNSIKDLENKISKHIRINDIFIEENYLYNNGDDKVYFLKNNGLDYAIQIEEFANGKVELKYISIL